MRLGSEAKDYGRDRLTGYQLDKDGGYIVPVVLGGVSYSPKFHSCGNSECLASGANIDFSDVNTLRWIRAADANSIDNLGKIFAAGSIVSSGGISFGMSNASTVASLLSEYLKEDVVKSAAATVLSSGFEKYAVARGLSAGDAVKVSNALGISGVWDNIFVNGKEIYNGK